MAQVLTAVCGVVAVVMVLAPFASFGCVATIFFTTNSAEKSLGFAAGGPEQFTKSLEPLTPQVAELLPVPFLHRPVKPVQHLQSFRRNPGQNHAPVLGVAASRNQASLLQSIQQPGDVWIPGDHALPDFRRTADLPVHHARYAARCTASAIAARLSAAAPARGLAGPSCGAAPRMRPPRDMPPAEPS
jgi:hypothetical protein